MDDLLNRIETTRKKFVESNGIQFEVGMVFTYPFTWFKCILSYFSGVCAFSNVLLDNQVDEVKNQAYFRF